MIIQVSMDIEVEENCNNDIAGAFANTIENTYDYPVLRASVTATWEDEEHYNK